MARDVKGCVAIVTGGGSGIGRAVCLELASRGARIAAVDISAGAAQEVVDQVRALGAEALAIGADVSSHADVAAAVGQVLDRWQRIDILVNSAGILQMGTIEEIDEKDWDQVLDVNLKGAFLFCKAVVPIMRRQGSGAIVNVSSVSGRTKALYAGPNYVASKAGLIGLTMSLANQLAADGIRVNCVAPGTIETPMNARLSPEERQRLVERCPMGRLGRPEEVAAAIAFLASPAASYITGETLNINGGVFMI